MNHSVYLIVTSLKLSHTNLFVNNLESRLLNRKGKKAVNSKKITLCQKKSGGMVSSKAVLEIC